MATLQQYYNAGADGEQNLSTTTTWNAQTFTVIAGGYSITSVKLLLFRVDNPGNVTLSIRTTSGGVPTGEDLTSTVVDCSGIATGSPYTWVEFTFSSPYSLTESVMYAIVLRKAGTGVLAWRRDASSPTFANGTRCVSSNSGSSWTLVSNTDFMFEIYGESSAAVLSGTITGSSSISGALSILAWDRILCDYDTPIFNEVRLTPKTSSTGAEGTIFYCSDDDSIYVGTE